MNGILNIGKNGLQALQNRVEIITNNIVNSNTPGYKKLDQSFQELVRNEVGKLGTPLSDKLDEHIPTIGSGVKSSNTFRIFEQGSLVTTDDSTQLAIDGNGFFAVKNANKDLLLTRSIKFNI
ncbi:MAG: flagellar hook-basal body complex protein, partial [Clostridia bacterium]|nr:flagellar hook-basal body complex protein [Clostridia bacterium]